MKVFIFEQGGGLWCWIAPAHNAWLHTDYRSPTACKQSVRSTLGSMPVDWIFGRPPGEVDLSLSGSDFGSRYRYAPGETRPAGHRTTTILGVLALAALIVIPFFSVLLGGGQ
jgi:hypothetical protein